jgi:hypothetical protein
MVCQRENVKFIAKILIRLYIEFLYLVPGPRPPVMRDARATALIFFQRWID